MEQKVEKEEKKEGPPTNPLETSSSKLLVQKEDKTKSLPFFSNTKISSCAYVKMKGGIPTAIPFFKPPPKNTADLIQPMTYTKSLYQ